MTKKEPAPKQGIRLSKQVKKLRVNTSKTVQGIPAKDFPKLGPMRRSGRKKHPNAQLEIEKLKKKVIDLKRIKENLLENEKRFKELFDEAPVGYHELDQKGRIARINRTELKMLGYTLEEMLGRPVWKFVVEAGTSRQAVLAKLAGKTTFSQPFERIYRRKDGKTLHVLIEDRILKDKKGKVTGIRSILQDITERKRMEEEIRCLNRELEHRVIERTVQLETARKDLEKEILRLRQAEGKIEEQRRLLEAILKQAADAIVVCDEQGKLTFINEAASTLALLDPKDTSLDLAPAVWGEAYDYDGRRIPPEERPLSKALRGELTHNRWLRIVHPQGPSYDVLISAVPLKGPGGQLLGAVATFSDITKRAQAEEEIKRLNEDLKRRNIELVNLNRELEIFTSSVSHDLRGPLVVIEGLTRRLSEHPDIKLDGKGKQYLERVQEACQRMSLLIEDLLRLSQVMQTPIKMKNVDLSALVQSIVGELQETNPERHVKCFVAEGLLARGEPRLLRIALENLIGNAWKFTKMSQCPTIEFGLTQREGEAIYFVQDNGCGFDMASADKIFKPFQRLHTPEEFPGTGIGLATVQRIIHQHGGRIWAESIPRKETTFYFTLTS